MDALRVCDVIAAIERAAPPDWADEWDNVGLQLGHPEGRVYRAAVTLELTEDALEETVASGPDLLITHHPVIFSPLYHLRSDSPTGDRILQLAGAGVALYCAHTNLDRSHLGPSAVLASELGLIDVISLQPLADLLKLVVYVPESDVEEVRAALSDAGAGHIGAYSHCTFSTRGTGTFMPGSGADPYVGSTGELARVDEYRMETVIPRHRLAPIMSVLHHVHPYEEPAFDLLSLHNRNLQVGMGRIGDLPEPVSARKVAERVLQVCPSDQLRAAGDMDRLVQRIAVCGGAGEKLADTAAATGAELFITGDVSHHGARDMLDAGMVVLDVGHAATEQPAMRQLAAHLRQSLGSAVQIEEVESFATPWD